MIENFLKDYWPVILSVVGAIFWSGKKDVDVKQLQAALVTAQKDIEELKDVPCIAEETCDKNQTACQKSYDLKIEHESQNYHALEMLIKENRQEMLDYFRERDRRQEEQYRQTLALLIENLKVKPQ